MKQKSIRVNLVMPAELKAELEAEVERSGYGLSTSHLIRTFCVDGLLRRKLERHEKKRKAREVK